MSESEMKKSGGGAGGSSVVLVEQSAASRHKHFRSTELQEEAPDLHHKRSRAPAVPSVNEELKDNANTESKDRRECERAMESEKQKHSFAKKLSATVKRRESSPEAITLAQLEVDTKKGTITPSSQPIPAQVESVSSADLAAKTSAENKEDDDSITDEIADLRTPEVVKKSSDWDFETGSRACVLERKSSIGPCFRSALSGRPSGIAISFQNKPSRQTVAACDQKSVINITVSKKCLINKTLSRIDNREREQINETQTLESGWASVKFLGAFKEKFSSMSLKIKEVLNA